MQHSRATLKVSCCVGKMNEKTDIRKAGDRRHKAEGENERTT